MPGDVKLHPAYSWHLDNLSSLATETFTETFGHLYPPEDLSAFLSKSYSRQALATEVKDARQFWRILWADGFAEGYVHAGPVNLPHPQADPTLQGEIKRIYVRKNAQGKGFGKTLLERGLRHLSEHYGDAPQWIGVWSENHRAQRLYGSYGFEKVGEYQFRVGGTLDDEFILKRVPNPGAAAS